MPLTLNGYGVSISGAGLTCAGTVWKSIRQDLKSTAMSAVLEGFSKQKQINLCGTVQKSVKSVKS